MEARIKSALSIVVHVWEGENETYFIDAFKHKLETLRENSSGNLRKDSPRNLRDSFWHFQEGVVKLKVLEGRAAKQPSLLTPETTTSLSQSKTRFELAGKRAKEALEDGSLSIEDKITASKIRIASAILQHLDKCELATRDLLRCLNELNSSVVAEVKAKSQKNLRDEILDSVIHINVNLADFIFNHTYKRMYVMEWPLIQYGKQLIHPFFFKNINEITATSLPWYTTDLRKNIDFFNKKMIVNREGELLVFDGNELQKLDSNSEKFQTWCTEGLNVENRQVECMNVDENGMVYLLLYGKDHPNGNYVLKLCLENRIVQNCSLHFLNDKNFSKIFLAATPNDKVILATVKSSEGKRSEINIYVCDSKGYCSELFDGLFRLVHHANGKVALLSSKSIIYIIKGSSEHDAMEVNLEWKETNSPHANTSTTAVMNSEPSGNHDATVVSDVAEDSDRRGISEIIYPVWLELGRMLGIPEENLQDSLPGEIIDDENCYEHHAPQQLPTESDLESFRSKDQAFQMLLLWEKEKGKDATRKKNWQMP
ncbi:uncharacterized protein LOC124456680 isoform X2 [Xenia sp. Carnegie-2017]|uniref:uncharacterized protein LOC124456680 isoform X2 n=1 Tax=Xenia sp. Carnegie-2017 TaxID=2897299 RepID=UPI001F0501F9|nr:uncharacterized protein LOC124456680 isoform X2 [Xenia sp. Carnegie-2017]